MLACLLRKEEIHLSEIKDLIFQAVNFGEDAQVVRHLISTYGAILDRDDIFNITWLEFAEAEKEFQGAYFRAYARATGITEERAREIDGLGWWPDCIPTDMGTYSKGLVRSLGAMSGDRDGYHAKAVAKMSEEVDRRMAAGETLNEAISHIRG